MITQVRIGHKYINISVAITNDEGVAFDPTNAEAWFYKVSQLNGDLNLDVNINGTGKVGLSKQDGQIGFYGTSIDTSSFLETEYVILYKITTGFAETITVEYFSIDSSKYSIADIWNYTTRTLTSISNVASNMWNYAIRTLTAGTKDTEIDAIKLDTDKIQTEIINKKDAYKADIVSLATEANATINKNELKTETDLIKIETDKIKNILGLVQSDFRILNPVYDANHNLSSATIKIYTNKSNTENDVDPIAEYTMSASYNAKNEMINYKVIKE